MKNALKHLQRCLRDRWHLVQARTAIARCNRNLARRRRIGAALPRPPRAPYFAPGVIEFQPRRARGGLLPYAVTVAVAVAGIAVLVVRGGLPT